MSATPGSRLNVEGLRPISDLQIKAHYRASIVGYVIWLLVLGGAVFLALWQGWWWPWLIALVPVVVLAQSLLLTPRRIRAIGYLDSEEDLTIARGIMFRSIETIPYGRIQSVTIGEGPIERGLGLANLSITTGADGAGTSLPGLPKAEAERLRALLTERSLALMAAL